ncbi:MAG: hypothetical protein IPI60_13575 [Saprospiraceae bacterium]|nr:hypothetical protein [Saprospiraceae bacterium]
MNSNVYNSEFYQELEASLHKSTFENRRIWVRKIIDENIAIKELTGLLNCEKKTANRFLWLLGKVG